MKVRLLAILLALATPLAFADDFDRAVASVVLLQNPKVQQDMKITEAQRSKLNALAKPFNDKMKKLAQDWEAKAKKDKNFKPDTSQQMSLLTKFKSDVFNVLTSTQITRLRQVSLQAIGIGALADETVAKKVGLSSTQLTNIRKALQEGMQKAQTTQAAAQKEAMKGIKEPKSEAERKKAEAQFNANAKKIQPKLMADLDKIKSSVISKVNGIMTPQQTTAWKGLLGPIFKG